MCSSDLVVAVCSEVRLPLGRHSFGDVGSPQAERQNLVFPPSCAIAGPSARIGPHRTMLGGRRGNPVSRLPRAAIVGRVGALIGPRGRRTERARVNGSLICEFTAADGSAELPAGLFVRGERV